MGASTGDKAVLGLFFNAQARFFDFRAEEGRG